MDNESEWKLIVRCRRGSTAAFEPLVRAHEAQALGFAEALLGDPDDAADAVQDAFVKAYRSLRRLQQGSAFGPWFRSILRHHCIDLLRSAPRRRRAGWDEARVDAQRSSQAMGSQAIEQAELAAAVHAALGRLSTEHREVLVLKEIEGMSYAELARTMGIPSGTVASRLYHARDALRRIIAADGILLDGVG